MRREVTLEEISDGKLYDANDMVRADCGDCQGCSACCKGMGESICLDPLDVYRLSRHLACRPEELLDKHIELHVMDGNILPSLIMAGKEERCTFLNEQGRCSIHEARPGICRLFPLGRFYENGGFRYFLQVHECRRENRSKIKVRKWIDTPDVKRYEQFVTDWHYFLKDVQEILERSGESELSKSLNLYVLKQFYMKPYEESEDFYLQFYQRLEQARKLVALGV